MRRFLALLLSLSITSSAGAVYLETETGRSGKPRRAPHQETRLLIDSVLLERAGQPDANGLSPAGNWLASRTRLRLSPEAMNACGQRLLNRLFEASDRTNVLMQAKAGRVFQVESLETGGAAFFVGGKFVKFSKDYLPPSKQVFTNHDSLHMVLNLPSKLEGKVGPLEANTYSAVLMDTIIHSPQRQNVIYTGSNGIQYLRMEAWDMGMAAHCQWDPVKPEFLDYLDLSPDKRWWVSGDGKSIIDKAVDPRKDGRMPQVGQAGDVGADLRAKAGPGAGERTANPLKNERGGIPAGEIFSKTADAADRLGFKRVAGFIRDRMYAAELADLPKVRRPGLPERTRAESLQKGQMTEVEWEGMRQMAMRFKKDIVLSGSLSETNLGLARRYSLKSLPKNQWVQAGEKIGIPKWRAEKPYSEMIDFKKGDVDIWEGSGLTRPEMDAVHKELFPSFKDVDAGYSLERYKRLDDFAGEHGPGAIVFRADGRVERIQARWQR